MVHGVILGSSWGHLGVILGSSWGHIGVILGSVTRSKTQDPRHKIQDTRSKTQDPRHKVMMMMMMMMIVIMICCVCFLLLLLQGAMQTDVARTSTGFWAVLLSIYTDYAHCVHELSRAALVFWVTRCTSLLGDSLHSSFGWPGALVFWATRCF